MVVEYQAEAEAQAQRKDSYKDGKLRQDDCWPEGFPSYIHPLSLPLSGS